MYRSQRVAKYVSGEKFLSRHPEIWPICVPSYNRPDPEIAKRASDDLPLVFFVRREQLPQYKHLRDRFRVVPIDGVKDIGETRSKILKWARVKGYDNIFMLDDDVTQVDYLYPWETSGGKLCLRASHINEQNGENGLRPIAFRMWQAYVDKLHEDTVITTISYRPNSWSLKYADMETVYNCGYAIQCVHLNVKKLCENGLDYSSNAFCGVEDYAIQFQAMEKGLRTTVIRDLMYHCPAINSNPGGCENMGGISDPHERYEHYRELFLKNISGKDHPGVGVKRSTSGFISIKFKWDYWKIKQGKEK